MTPFPRPSTVHAYQGSERLDFAVYYDTREGAQVSRGKLLLLSQWVQCVLLLARQCKAMVDAGWATAYRRYSADYVGSERRIRAARMGIRALGFVSLDVYRRAKKAESAPQASPDARCAVKGNVSSKGDRIYHLRGRGTT